MIFKITLTRPVGRSEKILIGTVVICGHYQSTTWDVAAICDTLRTGETVCGTMRGTSTQSSGADE